MAVSHNVPKTFITSLLHNVHEQGEAIIRCGEECLVEGGRSVEGNGTRAFHSTGHNVIDSFSQVITCQRVGGFASQMLCWIPDSP